MIFKYLNKNRILNIRLYLDIPLLILLLLLITVGFLLLYSATKGDLTFVSRQLINLGVSLCVMLLAAQLPPEVYRRWTPYIFILGIILLLFVILAGDSRVSGASKGVRRWLDLGFIRFQPSEIMKLALPLVVASFLSKASLPAQPLRTLAALTLIAMPTLLIAQQPDMGTAILIAMSGVFIIFLAGVSWKIIIGAIILTGTSVPVIWLFLMRDYQKQRIITLFNPEADPLGAGYHIIQSKIAIGSGGIWGKGWLHGTQSQLAFVPEHHTDFIFSVLGEEFGLIGALLLLGLYMAIIIRGIYIALQAQSTFSRLLCGSIVFTFFIYMFINIGMVSGIVPVVGVPLPLISYGGTSMVTLMAGFGILMSTKAHRSLLSR